MDRAFCECGRNHEWEHGLTAICACGRVLEPQTPSENVLRKLAHEERLNRIAASLSDLEPFIRLFRE
jgi:hypothetical protein